MQVILFSDIYRPFHGKGMGVYRLANHIRSHGYTVKVIHGFVKLTDDQFFDLCNRYVNAETLLIGLGATVLANLEQSKFFGLDTDIAKQRFLKLKEQYPKVSMCLGGAQVTGATDNFLQAFNYFDYIIKGQGETATVALLDHLSKNTPLTTNTVIRPKIITDKTYPFNEFNISSNFFIKDDAIQTGEGLPIELARGCIFKCKFCGYDLIGKKLGDFTKSGNIIREELIRNYNEWGTTDYYVADETINDSEEKVDMLLESVKGLPFRPTFGGFLRLDLLWKYPSMAQKLLDWGLEAASFGIETVNDSSGKAVGKGLGVKRIEESLTQLRSVWKDNVFVNASFILGLKHDTSETAIQLDEWISRMYQEKKLHTVFVKPLYIMPDTGTSFLDQRYVEQGYRIMSADQSKVITDRTRSVVPEDCLIWETDLYNFVQATHDADIIHKKYNSMKVCKGKIGKHNFAFIKSLLPSEYKEQLMKSQIHDVPFSGMSIAETETFIQNLDQAHFQSYLKKL
jgi:radical SAM superfamily enzyme YgiQ (UPF0313 family)